MTSAQLRTRAIAAATVVMMVAAATLWFGQFRYAGWGSVETDRWVGLTESDAVSRFGTPTHKHKGYRNVVPEPNVRGVTHSWEYTTLFGTLYLYFARTRCVESIYFDDDVQF